MWAFNEPEIYQKITLLRKSESQIFNLSAREFAPQRPARDITLLLPRDLPPKKGLSFKEGQARLLHDLASIELQAMELGLRTLVEFPEAPEEFKVKLWEITLEESEHLEMCLTEIESLGFKWGSWPAHCGLWEATGTTDSLLDRILIVHRYLEGSGLDAGDTLLKRLVAVDAPGTRFAAEKIFNDEIGHVLFGSEWYRKICQQEAIDPEKDFPQRMDKLRAILPKRINPVAVELRKKAGYTNGEISYLLKLRESFFDKDNPFKKKSY